MTAIPEPQLAKIRQLAQESYNDFRLKHGDSREFAATMLCLAEECWRAGYEIGRRHGRDE